MSSFLQAKKRLVKTTLLAHIKDGADASGTAIGAVLEHSRWTQTTIGVLF